MDKLTGHGRPPKSLAGKVGQHYEDLDTGDVYECRIANKYSTMHGWPVGGYIWELRAKGEDIQEFYGQGGMELPFGEKTIISELIPTQTILHEYIGESPKLSPNLEKEEGTLTVVFDGTEYECVVKTQNTGFMMMYRIGNLNKCSGSWEDTGEPFCIEWGEHTAYQTGWEAPSIYCGADNIEHTVQVLKKETVIETIDPKYLPENFGSATSWDDLGSKVEDIVPEQTINFTYDDEFKESYSTDPIVSPIGYINPGEVYAVVWDGVEYADLVAYDVDGMTFVGSNPSTGDWAYPFYIVTYNESDTDIFIGISTNSDSATHTVKITRTVTKPVPEKYISFINAEEIVMFSAEEITSTFHTYLGQVYELPNDFLGFEDGKTYRVKMNDANYNSVAHIDDSGSYSRIKVDDFEIYYGTAFNTCWFVRFESDNVYSGSLEIIEVTAELKDEYIPESFNVFTANAVVEEIIPETTLSFNNYTYGGHAHKFDTKYNHILMEGATYRVTIDSETYEIVAKANGYEPEENRSNVYLGDNWPSDLPVGKYGFAMGFYSGKLFLRVNPSRFETDPNTFKLELVKRPIKRGYMPDVLLTSPNGTLFKLAVADDGTLTATETVY